MELFFNKYESYADPQNDKIGNITCVCNYFSYNFSSGTYFLTGEIDSGAWSFVYSLLEENKSYKYPKNYPFRLKPPDIILNGESANINKIKELSFHVGQYKLYGKKTFKNVIKKALKKSKINYSFNNICEKFSVDEIFWERKMCAMSSRIWYISAAAGLAMNKKIFVFPWLSKIRILDIDFFRLFRILNQENVIVLVPCSDKIKIPIEEKFNIVRMNSLFEFDYENMDRELEFDKLNLENKNSDEKPF